jgi:hypothetical protein
MEISNAQIVIALIGLLGVLVTTVAAAFGIPAYTGLRRDMREQRAESQKDKENCDSVLTRLKSEIIALQGKIRKDTLPQWHKNQAGVILWVNTVYVQRFLAPFDQDASGVLGKSDAEVLFFAPELKETLSAMDKEVRDFGSATRHGVRFNLDSNRRYTIIKELSVDPILGVITFSGIACEERSSPALLDS